MMTSSQLTNNQNLSKFLNSGIYHFEDSNAVFMDPVRVLNLNYTHSRVSSSSYYSRFFNSGEHIPTVSDNQRKRKRKQKKTRTLNQREQAAELRHQIAKPFLVKAYECLLGANDLLVNLRNLRSDELTISECGRLTVVEGDGDGDDDECSFVEIGSVWQAPLFEISLYVNQDNMLTQGFSSVQNCEKRNIPAFERLIVNETNRDAEADFLNRRYIIPKQSSFFMSDLKQIHGLIPGNV